MAGEQIPQGHEEQVAEEETGGLSWPLCLGAVAGLVVGVVLALLGAAALQAWMPGDRTAEVFWQIAGPLLGIAGVVVGAFAYQRYLQDRIAVAAFLTLAIVALGLFLALELVGFPFHPGG